MELKILEDKKQKLEKEVEEYHRELNELIEEQATIKNVEDLAQSVIRYTEIENEISDRGLLLSLLSQDVEHFKSPYFKAQFGSYLDAAETCSPEIVNFITNVFHDAISTDFAGYKYADEFHTEYRQHIFPGKILAGRFQDLDPLVREMIDYIKSVDPKYDENLATHELYEAFKVALGMNINLEKLKKALEEGKIAFLTEEARKDLLAMVEEREKIRLYTAAKDQNVAMERAVKMLEQRESEI
ncbi:MAG: hypothetical protein ABH835_01390 [Patescibacteria group bacterium]|nr:hypothetical protein [Patescibacteria group bacterium]